MTLNLEHQAMRRARNDVADASSRLAAGRTAADRTVTGFLGGGWQGVAADAFRDAWEDWKVAADQVKDGLDTMALLLEAVHRDMVEQDTESQQALDQLAARINERLG